MIIDINNFELDMLYHFTLRELECHDLDNWETEEEANNHLRKIKSLKNKLNKKLGEK